jgi:class 3 adenylate cyclase
LVTGICVLVGLEVWLVMAVGLLCLTGVASLGGLRLLGPCALAIGVLLLLLGRGMSQAEAPAPATVASGMLVAVFLLGLALLSFRRVRVLDQGRKLARAESATLRHRNARLARYLPEQLAPLISQQPARIHRPRDQFVTVAFVDVVGFTSLVASRPVGELVDVLNDFIATLTALTERRGGVLSKFLGDGVLVYFPEPPGAKQEQRWQAAVSCALLCLDLRPALQALAATWRRQGLSVDLETRAGIASGFCAIGDWGGVGSGGRLDYTLIGTAVNLASRLQAEAPAGGVLLSAASARLISEDIRLAGLLAPGQVREIKGIGACMVHELGASAKVRANQKVDSRGTRNGSKL